MVQSWIYLSNSIVGLIWTNATLISEEYDTPVKGPHGVVQCRFLDVLDSGAQLGTTYNVLKEILYSLQ